MLESRHPSWSFPNAHLVLYDVGSPLPQLVCLFLRCKQAAQYDHDHKNKPLPLRGPRSKKKSHEFIMYQPWGYLEMISEVTMKMSRAYHA